MTARLGELYAGRPVLVANGALAAVTGPVRCSSLYDRVRVLPFLEGRAVLNPRCGAPGRHRGLPAGETGWRW